jgi:queuine tRNA-ribosyltransferase
LGGTLIGQHNLNFYKNFMARMRQEILNDTFEAFYQQTKEEFLRSDIKTPVGAPKKRRAKRLEELGNYRLHRYGDQVSIAQRSSGEVMHSVSDPMDESERLYISQSRLREKVFQLNTIPLTLWDVGLGAATNAMSAIFAYEEVAKRPENLSPLKIVSFENDLDSLRLAIRHPNLFAHLRHQAPHKILQSGKWQSDTCDLSWTLYEGDFLQKLLEAPRPDIIFFDPFSFKTDAALWTLQTFTQIFKHSGETELFTYSASTRVRAALLAAGFFVAKGVGTGPKAETTIALKGQPKNGWQRDILGQDWLDRWERSQNQMPLDGFNRTREIAQQIRSHPQFSIA